MPSENTSSLSLGSRPFCFHHLMMSSPALIGGALMALALMLAFETPHLHWTSRFIEALAWNTIAMSIVGMAIYNLMLDRFGAGRASSGFFIVPGASAIMAFALLDEHLSTLAVAGLIASTLGVLLVWWRRSANDKRPAASRRALSELRRIRRP